MPELPEVETTRRGLAPLVRGRSVERLEVREPRLRWPVGAEVGAALEGRRVTGLGRRGKYLLFETDGGGTLLVHLGMSGSLRFHAAAAPTPGKHDHVDLHFEGGALLRFNDPRRFGSLHFTESAAGHALLRDIGPEPLGPDFTPDYLWQASRGRRVPIKAHLMNAHVVAGVGNIYANEALFRAGLHPARSAGRIARPRVEALVAAVRAVLAEAIEQGGTTLRDFRGGDGKPGYFQLALEAYGRAGEPCSRCGGTIRLLSLGQRATYYCPGCQR